MVKAEALLMDVLRCAVRGEQLEISEMPEQDTLRRLFRLAREQTILPLVIQVLSNCPELQDYPLVRSFRREARFLTLHQARRTGDFLLVLKQLEAQGLHPAVLKGLVCRSLYPEPEQRPSTDEDLFVPAEELSRYHEALLSCGLRRKDPDRPLEEEDEAAYVDPERDLYLEVHVRLFSEYDEACAECNLFFVDALERMVTLQAYGQTVYTLAPTDHLLFLFCHAYKHMLYGGVGVRQICDICLLADRYSHEIDWKRLIRTCEDLNILTLAAAFFRVGERHLFIPCPAAFSELEVDELPLLADCLSGGVYGVVDPDRQHSSRITLDAVAAAKQGRAQSGIWHSLFPGKAYLQNNYSYAKAHPTLLPVAWAQRLWNYAAGNKTNAAKSLQIGRERIELLKQYKIIS